MNTIDNKKFDKIEDFTKAINKLRQVNKGKWYQWVGTVAGKSVELKGFGTWLQIFRVDGLNSPSCMEIPVSTFKDHLNTV